MERTHTIPEPSVDDAIQTVSLTKRFQGKSRRVRFPFGQRKPQDERVVAIDHVNLRIPKGSIYGLLGPNGAGKTTTIKVLSTLLIPDEGTAYVNGFDVVRESNSVRSTIGVVTGGDRGLYWRLTGRENLLFFARLYGIRERKARSRIEDLLKIVDLQDRSDDLVEKYSRGMKQRLHLLRGLIHDPPVLLLDEPTVGLDPNSAVAIREFIKEKLQREQRKTILLTTHYMEEADQLCDKVAIIDHGKIIANGPPKDLKTRLRETDFLKITASHIPQDSVSELKEISGVQGIEVTSTDIGSGLSELVVQTTNAEETLPELAEAMVKMGFRIRAIEQSRPSLEDVFISLTGRQLKD